MELGIVALVLGLRLLVALAAAAMGCGPSPAPRLVRPREPRSPRRRHPGCAAASSASLASGSLQPRALASACIGKQCGTVQRYAPVAGCRWPPRCACASCCWPRCRSRAPSSGLPCVHGWAAACPRADRRARGPASCPCTALRTHARDAATPPATSHHHKGPRPVDVAPPAGRRRSSPMRQVELRHLTSTVTSSSSQHRRHLPLLSATTTSGHHPDSHKAMSKGARHMFAEMLENHG